MARGAHGPHRQHPRDQNSPWEAWRGAESMPLLMLGVLLGGGGPIGIRVVLEGKASGGEHREE